MNQTEKIEKTLTERGMTTEQQAGWMRLHERDVFASDYLLDRDGNPWNVREYQRESLKSHATRKVHCDGRDVGKTTEIELLVLWASVACPNREMLVATQCESHLYPLMKRILERLESEELFRRNIVEIRRDPGWHLRFANGFVLWGRIAGARGVNFQGMHVDWQVVDEAQEMAESSWAELYQALNGGGRRWVYGVPNGKRGSFYQMSQDPANVQFNWPSSLNPDFDRAKELELERRRIKEFMTELLSGRMREGTIVFPRSADRESQYASHTYSVGDSGRVVYEKGHDHIIDADRCAILRWYEATQYEDPVPIRAQLDGFRSG